MRGYFGIGVEGINKPFNVGNLFRSAHAFDASFVFTIDATYRRAEGAQTDTSDALASLPFYSFPKLSDFLLPKGCALVGVELHDDAVDLPSFTHPRCAAYVLGPERSSLSPELTARCDHLLRIPTRFCLNVGIAGVVVMYDRLLTMAGFRRARLCQAGPRALLCDSAARHRWPKWPLPSATVRIFPKPSKAAYPSASGLALRLSRHHN